MTFVQDEAALTHSLCCLRREDLLVIERIVGRDQMLGDGRLVDLVKTPHRERGDRHGLLLSSTFIASLDIRDGDTICIIESLDH